MNKHTEKLANIWANRRDEDAKLGTVYTFSENALQAFTEKLVNLVLDEVEQRAYYSGDRAWSDTEDRQWIQLEFGFGKLYEATR